MSINLESYLFGSRQNCYTQGRNSEVRLGCGEACTEGLFNCFKKGGGRGEEGEQICVRMLIKVFNNMVQPSFSAAAPLFLNGQGYMLCCDTTNTNNPKSDYLGHSYISNINEVVKEVVNVG